MMRARKAIRNHAQHAFTMLETISVIMLLSLLSLWIASHTLQSIQRSHVESELNMLQALEETMRLSILSTKQIPGPLNWHARLAASGEQSESDILMTPHQTKRYVIFHPHFFSSQVGPQAPPLPFAMPREGMTQRPEKPRCMIISSTGAALPESFLANMGEDGAVSAEWFEWLWSHTNQALAESWQDWANSQHEQLCIQRINLDDLFVPLILNNTDSGPAFFAIESAAYSGQGLPFPDDQILVLDPSELNDGNLTVNPLFGRTQSAYYLKGSLIEFYHQEGEALIPHAHKVLQQPSTFYYEVNRWRSHFEGVEIHYPEGNNMERIANLFLSVPTNPRVDDLVQWGLSNITNQMAMDYMLSFLEEYEIWASSGYPSINPQDPLPQTANILQAILGELLDLQESGGRN